MKKTTRAPSISFSLQISGSSGVVGMTHEHLEIAVALEVPFFVVITKIDLVSPEPTLKNIEELLKSPCFRKVPFLIKSEDDVITAGANGLADNVVPIFCLSSVTGHGLDVLRKFLHVLPPSISVKEKERLEEVRFVVLTGVSKVLHENYIFFNN